ncbi:hypothetical protein Tco_0580725 [Tanacetum coccineum]
MASLLAKRVASNLLRVRTIASSSRFLSCQGYQYVQHDSKGECILKYDDKIASSIVRGLVNGDGGGGGVTTGKVRRDNGRWWLVVDASNNVDTLEFTEIFNKRNQDSWLEMITIEAWWKGQMHGKGGNKRVLVKLFILVPGHFSFGCSGLLGNGDGIRFSCCTVSTNVDLFICGCISPDLGISPLCSVGALLWMELVRLEEACKALRTFKVLEIEKEPVIVDVTCMDNASIKILSVWLDQVMTKLKGHQKRITGLAFSELHGVWLSSPTPPRDVIDKVAKIIVTAMATYKTETASSTSPHEKTGSAKRSLLTQLSSEAKKKKRYNFNKAPRKLLLTISLKCNLQTDIPGVKPCAPLRSVGEKPCCYEK